MIGDRLHDQIIHEKYDNNKTCFKTNHNREIHLRVDENGTKITMRTEMGIFTHTYPKDWNYQKISEQVVWLFKMMEDGGEFDPLFKYRR